MAKIKQSDAESKSDVETFPSLSDWIKATSRSPDDFPEIEAAVGTAAKVLQGGGSSKNQTKGRTGRFGRPKSR